MRRDVFRDRVRDAGGGTGFTADVECSACRAVRTVEIAENGWYGFDCCGRWHTSGFNWRELAKLVDGDAAKRCLVYAGQVEASDSQRRASGEFF